MTRIGLLGCGSWGTTLAQILAKKGETVNAWHYRKDFVDAISIRVALPASESRPSPDLNCHGLLGLPVRLARGEAVLRARILISDLLCDPIRFGPSGLD